MSDDSIRSLLDKVSTLSLLEPHTTCRDGTITSNIFIQLYTSFPRKKTKTQKLIF